MTYQLHYMAKFNPNHRDELRYCEARSTSVIKIGVGDLPAVENSLITWCARLGTLGVF